MTLTWPDVLSRRAKRETRSGRLHTAAVVMLALTVGAAAQDGEGPEPLIVWQGEQPTFFERAFFAREADGEPLPSRGGELAERWGYYVWSARPLWFVVDTNGGADGARLCAQWLDPTDDRAEASCAKVPSGPSRLAFRGPENADWPVGRYVVKLSVERGLFRKEREPLADVSYAIGPELPGAGPSPNPTEIPSFPWPPPQPTTQTVLDRALLVRDAASLGDVARRLTTALDNLDYSEHSFYSVPGGFALATRLEQIEFDGTPKGDPLRWSAALPPRQVFSLRDFISALFSAPEGHYRVLVFVVTDRPFSASGAAASQSEALAWLRGGFNALPPSVADMPLERGHVGTALIYQYRKVGQQREAIANPDGAAPAVRQLERSGILSALAR